MLGKLLDHLVTMNSPLIHWNLLDRTCCRCVLPAAQWLAHSSWIPVLYCRCWWVEETPVFSLKVWLFFFFFFCISPSCLITPYTFFSTSFVCFKFCHTITLPHRYTVHMQKIDRSCCQNEWRSINCHGDNVSKKFHASYVVVFFFALFCLK